MLIYAQSPSGVVEAVERQRELTRFVADRQVVVQTGVLRDATDEWRSP